MSGDARDDLQAIFWVQSFKRSDKALKPLRRIRAASAADAMATASALVPMVSGSVAFSEKVDPTTGRTHDSVLLGEIGSVPGEFVENLRHR